ncbi:MAG: 2-hydroxychromene-2-carboxylate isomerase, partial [Betaproteobacteria bacterium]
MSTQTLEFHFDFGSPTSYLAYTQVPRIVQDTGATLVWHPVLLGGVFKATGNASPITVPAKGRWMNEDMARWARRWGVPFAMNPHFPVNTLTLMRGACGMLMRRPDDFKRYADTMYRALWVDARNLNNPGEVAAVLAAAGFDAAAFMALVADPEVKADLIARTEASVARGTFGAPTIVVGAQRVFGQDRLDCGKEARAAGMPP